MKTCNLSRYAKNLIVLAALMSAGSAYSAGYLKIDGVDGEAKSTTQEPATPTTPKGLKSNTKERPTGLLLPAVQKAAEKPTANDSDSKKPKRKVESQRKVE